MSRLIATMCGVLLGGAMLLLPVSPAAANTIDSFTVLPATATPGTVVTATATWTATDDGVRDIFIQLPGGLLAVWDSASTVPARNCVIDTPPTEAACFWNAHVSGDQITLTAQFTVPANTAAGTYTLIATASPEDDNGPLTQDLVVPAPSPTATPSTPSTAPSTSASVAAEETAVPTAVPAGQVSDSPNTGGFVSIAAFVGLAAAGATAFALARRKGRYQV